LFWLWDLLFGIYFEFGILDLGFILIHFRILGTNQNDNMPYKKSFASDNNAPVHEKVMEAIQNANQDDVIAYGNDPYTHECLELFKKVFHADVESFLVYNGTGANVSAITNLIKPFHAVMCAETAHMNKDECGAPERYAGCKLLPVPTTDGKLRIEQLKKFLHSKDFEHHVQPKIISITQATELGTLYSIEEIRNIVKFAHDNELYVHIDGARIANAVAALGPINKMLTETEVDAVSFGGTKNGLMFGEAVVFINPSLAKDYKYIRKQSMQLASKMRYIAAQFNALLSNELWINNAQHANNMAKLLEEKVSKIPEIQITQPVQTNAVFATLPEKIIKPLQEKFFFYVWNHENNEVRWMTSFDTDEKDIEIFVDEIKRAI